jgi:uroporphyrinogen-III synthase
MEPNVNVIKGKTIICTYPPSGNDELTMALNTLGATILWLPMIEVEPIQPESPIATEQVDWFVFTSKNGVRAFFDNKQELTSHQKIAVLGESTARELANYNQSATFVGSGTSGEQFAKELASVIQKGEEVLLLLGNLAPNTLQTELQSITNIHRVNVYQTSLPKSIDKSVLERVKTGNYDALIVTSPSAIKNLAAQIGDTSKKLKIISIGTTTTNAMIKLGIEPLATANEQSYKGLAIATIQYFEQTHLPKP